jgi:hypothetical protein
VTRALLCLLLGGCVQVVPIVDQRTHSVSCCEALVEMNHTTDGSITITKPAQNLEVKLGARWKF